MGNMQINSAREDQEQMDMYGILVSCLAKFCKACFGK